jgi:hypothetical protein
MNDELIVKVKAWIADPTKAPLLHDLLHEEAARIIEGIRAQDFAPSTPYSDLELARLVAACEETSGDLGRSFGLGGFWGHPNMRPLWPGLIGRLSNGLSRAGGLEAWFRLRLYPAVLALYSGGVAATAARRYDTLAALFTEATVDDGAERNEAVLELHAHRVLEPEIAQRLPGLERRHTPMSDHVASVIRPWLADILPLDSDFERQFDRFEYLLGLEHYDIRREKEKGNAWGPIGRFSWRRITRPADVDVALEIEQSGTRWPLLTEGLFGGSSDRLAESVKGFNALVARVRYTQL